MTVDKNRVSKGPVSPNYDPFLSDSGEGFVPKSPIGFLPESPPVQGFAPESPPALYVESPRVQGESPDSYFRPEEPLYEQTTEGKQQDQQLQEDNYDYDTEEEYGFYDPGPANLEEVIREYEESRRKIREQQESNELPSAFDENFRAFEEEGEDEKKDEPQRTVIEKDFQEGLNLLATNEDENKDENNSGDEEDSDKKSVTA